MSNDQNRNREAQPFISHTDFKIRRDFHLKMEKDSVVETLYDIEGLAYDILEDEDQASTIEAALNTIEELVIALERAGKI